MPQKRRFFKAMKLTFVPAECVAHREKGAGEAAAGSWRGRVPDVTLRLTNIEEYNIISREFMP